MLSFISDICRISIFRTRLSRSSSTATLHTQPRRRGHGGCALVYIAILLASNKDPVRLSRTEKGPLQLKKD